MEILLGSKEYKRGKNKDCQTSFTLQSTFDSFRETSLFNLVDEEKLFNLERGESERHILYGKVDLIVDDGSKGQYPTPPTSFTDFTPNNWSLSVVYPKVYVPLPNYVKIVTDKNGVEIFLSDVDNLKKNDIIALYVDDFIYLTKILNINGLKIRVDSVPTDFITKSYVVLPSVCKFERYYENMVAGKDISIYNSGYGTNIYGTQINQFHVKKDVILTGLKNTLNQPITDLYYHFSKSNTILKWAYKEKTETLSYSADEISNVNGEPYSKNVMDIYEYDFNQLQGNVIHERYESYNNLTQFYYKSFYNIPIRKYSNVLNSEVKNDLNVIPSNYIEFTDGTIMWRDILDVGYMEEGVNGLDYPFMNGYHYNYNDIKLFVRRNKKLTESINKGYQFIMFNNNTNVQL